MLLQINRVTYYCCRLERTTMANVKGATTLVVLLLAVRVSRSHNTSTYCSGLDTSDDAVGQNTMHNVSVDCSDHETFRKTVWDCQRDLVNLSINGYPWYPRGSHKHSRNSWNVADRNTTLRDALDALNDVCQIHERTRTCLVENGIRDFCLLTTGHKDIQINFHFICHYQRRDENLVHSLQCLHDKRVLVMLYFHIADRCRGFSILDDIMRTLKNAYFFHSISKVGGSSLPFQRCSAFPSLLSPAVLEIL